MDNQNQKLQKVKEILKQKGATDEQIEKTTQAISQAASDQLYAYAMSMLREEDLQAIDKCQNQEEANKEILNRFKQRTGKDPDQLIQEFLGNFAEGFLREYGKESNQAV